MSAGTELYHCMSCGKGGQLRGHAEHLATCKPRMRALAVAEAQGNLERACKALEGRIIAAGEMTNLTTTTASDDPSKINVVASFRYPTDLADEIIQLCIEFGRALNMPSV